MLIHGRVAFATVAIAIAATVGPTLASISAGGAAQAAPGGSPDPSGSARRVEQAAVAEDTGSRSEAPDFRVKRDRSGRLEFLGGTSGRAFRSAPSASTARAAAISHRDRYAPSFGLPASDLDVSRIWPSASGGSVVRLRQHVDGLPVLGGEMVMDLDGRGGLLSVHGDFSDRQRVPSAVVPAKRAAGVALASIVKEHGRRPTALTIRDEGQWLYDPALLGVRGGLDARRVWRFEVTDHAVVREMVLVDAQNGRVLLRVDDLKAHDRQICDGRNSQESLGSCVYMPYPARTETGPESAVADVNSAFELTGATADMYAEVAGLDLTKLIGTGGGSYPKRLLSWVRYCPTPDVDPTCPMTNAYWNGAQMFFGDGFAGADDVVGHELTHGVIEEFSDLFYFHQSGAINESLADIMGEIFDHRHPSPGDAPDDWRLGEDAPGGALRDLADPTLFGQPDKVTSPLYDADPNLADNGGVHTNSGIGNKTAYLISQGGSFNGVTTSGIDSGDPGLTKTATLYTEAIKRLSSGSGYADLARVLEQTCAELAAASTAGFTGADCVAVSAAVTATELLKSPTAPGVAPPPDAVATCPEGTDTASLFSNAGTGMGLTTSAPNLWFTAPNATYGIPRNARTGATSLFAFDPEPSAYGDPSSSSIRMTDAVTVPIGQPTYLHFDHWRLFEWAGGDQPTYHDGGQVTVYATDAAGVFQPQPLPADAWDNGPADPLTLTDPANPVLGFGGDSHGWTSSRLDLSSFGGRQVRVRWTVRGDQSGAFIGWYLDNLKIYTCQPPPPPPPPPTPPGAVTQLEASPLPGPKVRLSWERPTDLGDGLTGYSLTRSDGGQRLLPPELPPEVTMTITETDLAAKTNHTFTIRPLGEAGIAGPATSVSVVSPTVSVTAPRARVAKGTRLTFNGTVFAVGTRAAAADHYVTLHWRKPGTTTWRAFLPTGGTVSTSVGIDGRFRLRTIAKSSLTYRIAVPSYPDWFPGQSQDMKVRVVP